MFRSSILAATALFAAQALSQTSTSCNPTKRDGCPNPPALGTTYNQTWTAEDTELDASFWNVTAGESLISFDDSGMQMVINKQGDSVTAKSEFYIFWGSVSVIMKAAEGQGIISTMNLLSDDLDEVDWEIMGGNDTYVSSNWYGMGNTSQHNGAYHPLANAQEGFHNYTVSWNQETLEWILDGNVVRSVPYAGAGNYPQTPCYINLGLWAGGDPSLNKWTILWAGGETNYNKAPFTMTIKSIQVTDGSLNTSSYIYEDQTGSYQSIKAVDGESEAFKELNTETTKQKVEKHWQGLSQGEKIGIACGVLGFVAVCIVAWTFVCISQRRKGKAERQLADQQWEKERADFNMYRAQMAKGGFAISSQQVPNSKF